MSGAHSEAADCVLDQRGSHLSGGGDPRCGSPGFKIKRSRWRYSIHSSFAYLKSVEDLIRKTVPL